MASPLRSSRVACASAVPPPRALEIRGADSPSDVSVLPGAALSFDACNPVLVVDERWAGKAEENCDTRLEPTTAEAAADECVLPQMAAAPTKFRLHIRCNDLLDCDVFSKSDPYAIVMGGDTGQRPQDFVELGRTEVVQDCLDPVFETAVDVGSRPSDPQVMVIEGCDARAR